MIKGVYQTEIEKKNITMPSIAVITKNAIDIMDYSMRGSFELLSAFVSSAPVALESCVLAASA